MADHPGTFAQEGFIAIGISLCGGLLASLTATAARRVPHTAIAGVIVT